MEKFGPWLKRTLWSALANALAAVVGPAIFDFALWKGAATAAVSTVLTALLAYARQQGGLLPEAPKP